MARIRTIKPGFFTSITVSEIDDPWTRLCFIGLWTHVDDDGRALADPRLIKAALFPLVEQITFDSVTDMLDALADRKLIALYEVADRRYLMVKGWAEHQKISHPSKSILPAPDDPSAKPLGRLTEASVNPLEPSGWERKGKEGKGTFAPTPKTTPALPAPAPRSHGELWTALASRFGEPQTDAEKSNRGRQCKELAKIKATADDVTDRCNEHASRRLPWQLTANALITHWTELEPRKSPAHLLNGVRMSREAMARQ